MAEQPLLVLDRDTVAELLDPQALEAAVAASLIELSAGTASMPKHIAPIIAERDAQLLVMAGYLPATHALASKTVAIFPGNAALGKPTHQALIILYDAEDGSALALMDGTHITATRTAAASALATRLLAREDATILSMLGTGVQARDRARSGARLRRDPDRRPRSDTHGTAGCCAGPAAHRPGSRLPRTRAGGRGSPCRVPGHPRRRAAAA